MVEHLEKGEAKNVTVDRRHALKPPVFRMLAQHRVELWNLINRPLEKVASEAIYRCVDFFRAEKCGNNMGRGMFSDLPLEEHLQGEFTGFSSGSHVEKPKVESLKSNV